MTTDHDTLLRALRTRVPVDAADMLLREPPAHIGEVLDRLPRYFAARVAAHLPPELMPDGYEAPAVDTPGTVGELMEAPTGVVPPDMSVGGAIEFLRTEASASEITYLYVTDPQQTLLGLIVLRDLLLAPDDAPLSQIMLRAPFSLRAEDSLADAVKVAGPRHYPVYPVCVAGNRLVGIVRGWRLFEQQAEEISAQTGRMVGLDKEERVTTGLWEAFRLRHPWLQINLLTAFLAGGVVSVFEDTISRIVALAAFLPILAGQSGNTGCQALAITLRGLTLGELDAYPVRKVVVKEVTLGALNGLFTGFVAGVAMWLTAGGFRDLLALKLGAVIALAMIGSCSLSGLFGVLVPLTLKKLGADPSTASSIFLTTGTDIAGMGLMLFLATTLVL